MNAFLTGSRVYGTPHEKSDIDLVVFVSPSDLKLLEKLTESEDLGSPGGAHYEDGRSFRFGNLNLLCVTDQRHYDVWKAGTEQLLSLAPVTRDTAIEHLAKLRQQNKIEGWG